MGGVTATTAAATAIGYKYGIIPDFLDAKMTPGPTARPEVVDGMVAVNEAIRDYAPVVAIGAIATVSYFNIAARFSNKKQALNELSKTDYSGFDELQSHGQDSVIDRIHERTSVMKKGAGIAALAIVLTSATSGVEFEVSNGPLRPIEAVTTLVATDANNLNYVLQGKNNTFMDDSVIAKNDMKRLQAKGATQGVTVLPFNKELFNINDKSALEVSLPDVVFSKLASVEIDDSCDTVPVIVDDTLHASIGEEIMINNHAAQVVGIEENIAQMNRSIAIVSDTDMKECLKDGTDSSYFGAIIPDANKADLEVLLETTKNKELSLVTQESFKENNRDFWRANGTPVLLQLIGYIAIFGGLAAAGERKNALQRNVKEIGTLHASGVSFKDLRAVEHRRAVKETLKASVIAAPFIPIVTGAFNAAELGMKVGAGPREFAVGIAATLGAKLFASRRAINDFEKNLDLSQAVKG